MLPHVLFGPRTLQGLIKPPHLGAGLGCPAQPSPHSYIQGKTPQPDNCKAKLGGSSKSRIWLFPLELDLVTPVKHFLCSAGCAWAGTATWFHSSSSTLLTAPSSTSHWPEIFHRGINSPNIVNFPQNENNKDRIKDQTKFLLLLLQHLTT